MSVAVVLLTVLTILWIYWLWSRRKYYAFALKVPGPRGLPFIGIAHRLRNIEDILYTLPKLAAECKAKTCSAFLGPILVLYTVEPEIAEIVLNSPFALQKGSGYDILTEMFGPGILTSKVEKWTKHRKLLNPCLSFKVLQSFVPKFNKLSLELCEEFDKLVNCGEIDMKKLTYKMSFKVALGTTMGLDLNTAADELFLTYVERFLELAVYRFLNPLLRSKTIFQKTKNYKEFAEAKVFINNFVSKVVLDKIKAMEDEELKNKSQHSKDSINIEKPANILIEQVIKIYQRNEFTFEDIISECTTMIIAGFETTGAAIYSLLIHLAMNPKYQEQLYEEIITVLPNEETIVSSEDIKNLVYLDMCLNESLRLTPSVPLVLRVCTDDLPIAKDVTIPKGTEIFVDMFNIHRDEDIWGPKAKIFDPDHFLPENLHGKHNCSFLPFLKGPRNCIGWQYAGMLAKISLVHFVRRFRFSTTCRFEDLRCMESVTIKYVPEPKISIERR